MIKNVTIVCFLIILPLLVAAQDYPQWPADRPETDNIEESQSREVRIGNDILPKEIDMQDRMRLIISTMMKNAAKQLGWEVAELSEYTNNGPLQGAGTPYPLRSPRSLSITFQFIVNSDSLHSWKNYKISNGENMLTRQQESLNNIQTITESAVYKRYQDSANHYMNLYTTYCEAHKNEGANLYNKDPHPRYYQQKENEFINKMTAMTQKAQDESGMDQAEENKKDIEFRFRNHTVLQVSFHINQFRAYAIDQSLGPIISTSAAYPKEGTIISKMYSISRNQENKDLVKWNHVLMMLLGNFQTKPDAYGYPAGFNLKGQGDEHTPKKIKSDKVQNISITIFGSKSNVEKIASLIDVEKLNREVAKN